MKQIPFGVHLMRDLPFFRRSRLYTGTVPTNHYFNRFHPYCLNVIVRVLNLFCIVRPLHGVHEWSDTVHTDGCLNDDIRDVREQHIEIISHWFTKHVIKKEGGKIKTASQLFRRSR